MNKINCVRLYIKKTPKATEIGEIVKKELLANNIEINDELYDAAISIGGDGTFLKMIHANNFNTNIYYVGINAGSLGFLSPYNESNLNDLIMSLNNVKEKNISVLKTTIDTQSSTKEYLSINEFTVRNNNFVTFKSDVYINDTLLEKYVGDGLVVSTAVGSTAYNMALTGPIIDEDINSFVLTPIAPINNKVFTSLNNSFVLSSNKTITIIPITNNNLCILNDGKIENISGIKKITSCISNIKIKTIIPNNYNYVDVIKSKIIDVEK